MYAIIKTGSKQYRVKEGDIIDIEKLHSNSAPKVTFDDVLLLGSAEGSVQVGAPMVAGAKVQGFGTPTITIQGVSSLVGVPEYQVIPDRVEAGTLLVAGAITRGDVTVTNVDVYHLKPIIDTLQACELTVIVGEDTIRIKGNKRPKAVDICTEPFPGFPTDMQAQIMTLLTIATGKSVIKERIFDKLVLPTPIVPSMAI